MSDPRPIGVFDSGVGGLTVLREILRRLPFESTVYLGDNARAPYGVRTDDEVRRFSVQALDALVRRDVKALVVACNTSTSVALGRFPAPLRPAGPGRRPARVRRPRRWPREPPRRRHRHAGHGPLAGLLQRHQGREPGRRGLRARHSGARAARRGRAALPGPKSRRRSGGPWRRCWASANEDGDFIFPLPPSARIDTLLLGCTHYPLLAGVLRDCVGDGVAIVDSATATASSLAELLSVNAPGGARARRAARPPMPGMAGHEPPDETLPARRPTAS